MPLVGETRPHPVGLRPGGSGVVLLSGVRLDAVVSAAAVTAVGLHTSAVQVSVHREPDLDPSSLLVLLLWAHADASPAQLSLRLDTPRGAVYVDPDVARIVVLPAARRESEGTMPAEGAP